MEEVPATELAVVGCRRYTVVRHRPKSQNGELMNEQRIQERDRVFTELGFLLRPLRDLIYGQTPIEQISFIQPKVQRDYSAFTRSLHSFATAADGTLFASEYSAVINDFHSFLDHCFTNLRSGNLESAQKYFEMQVPGLRTKMRAIPCEQPEGIFSAETPFQTYQVLRAVFATAGNRVDLLDPYLDAEVFHLYLSQVPLAVPINLVASSEVMAGMASNPRRDRIIEASKMFAAERPTAYRFAVVKGNKALHDRHLRVDDSLYHLGGSLKDASDTAPFTMSKLSKIGGSELDRTISNAEPWFEKGMDWKRHKMS